jgi:hypothetical protein
LQHFVGIFKKISEFVAGSSKSFGGELSGNFDSSHGRIFGDIADFVDLDAVVAGQCGLQLFRK